MRTIALASIVFWLCSCSAPKSSAEGAEKGPCYGNNTCNEGLSCYSDLCVKAPDSSSHDGREAELEGLRAKLEASEMTVSRLKTLLEAEELTRTDATENGDSLKSPGLSRRPKKTKSLGRDIMENPFTDSESPKAKHAKKCKANPNLPECMLD